MKHTLALQISIKRKDLESCLFRIFIRQIKGLWQIVYVSKNWSRKVLKVRTRTTEDREDEENEGKSSETWICATPVLSLSPWVTEAEKWVTSTLLKRCEQQIKQPCYCTCPHQQGPLEQDTNTAKEELRASTSQRCTTESPLISSSVVLQKLLTSELTDAVLPLLLAYLQSHDCFQLACQNKSECGYVIYFLKQGDQAPPMFDLFWLMGSPRGPEFSLYTIRPHLQTVKGQKSAIRVLWGQRSDLKIAPFALYFPDAFI